MLPVQDLDLMDTSLALDAHALLVRIYQDEGADMPMRLDAAKAAIRFEKPALASVEQRVEGMVRNVVILPARSESTDEWLASVASLKAGKP